MVGYADNDNDAQVNDDIWRGQPVEVEPTKEEEFEQYFKDMFL